jgi:hypothetical protein
LQGSIQWMAVTAFEFAQDNRYNNYFTLHNISVKCTVIYEEKGNLFWLPFSWGKVFEISRANPQILAASTSNILSCLWLWRKSNSLRYF